MSDRKYRQRGYQDEGPRERRPQAPRDRGSRPNPATRACRATRACPTCRVSAKCSAARGAAASNRWPSGLQSTCTKCGADLHACVQCGSFDAGATFECMQQIPVRVSAQGHPQHLHVLLRRASKSNARPDRRRPVSGAKKAFDDLFKF